MKSKFKSQSAGLVYALLLMMAQVTNWWQMSNASESDGLFKTSCDLPFDRIESLRLHSARTTASDAELVYRDGEVTISISRPFAERLAKQFSRAGDGVLAPAMGWFLEEMAGYEEDAWPIEMATIGPDQAEIDNAYREWQSEGDAAVSYPASRAYQLAMWRNIGGIMVDWALAQDAAHIEIADQQVGTYARILFSGPIEEGFQPYSAASFALNGREIKSSCISEPV